MKEVFLQLKVETSKKKESMKRIMSSIRRKLLRLIVELSMLSKSRFNVRYVGAMILQMKIHFLTLVIVMGQ